MDATFGTADSLRVERDPGAAASFSLSGELDISNFDRLLGAVGPVARPGDEVRLRLSGLEFMDSSGIRALLTIAESVRPGGRLVIEAPSAAVRRVFDVVGADRFPGFDIVTS